MQSNISNFETDEKKREKIGKKIMGIHIEIIRVVYDRVRKRNSFFEIPTFLQIEQGKSTAGKFKTSNENKNVFVFI